MNQCCLICNNRLGVSPRLATNVFKEFATLGKSIATVLSEILQQPISEGGVPSNVICKLCQKNVVEYDLIKTRLQVLQSDLRSQFKSTLSKHNHDADSPATTPVKTGNTQGRAAARVVLPASKLQPLPPDYVINVGKLAAGLGSKSNLPLISPVTSASSSTLNLKVTVGSSVLTQSLKTTKPQKTSAPSPSKKKQSTINKIDKVTEANINSALASIFNNRNDGLDMDSMPKDLFSPTETLTKKEVMKMERDEENDGQPMEIDQDCTSVGMTDENNFSGKMDKSDLASLAEDGADEEVVEEAGVCDEEGGELVLRVLPAGGSTDTDERQTVVMSREDGTILRVVSGQRLVYEAGHLELLPATDDERSPGGDDDAHESNDESQIELQVSGDEETANAIIAAAQEQGGAFIKVESGEMFRVKSVQSKKQVIKEDADDDSDLVAYDGNTFKCLVCEKYGDPMSLDKSEDGAAAMAQHVLREHGARAHICHWCGKVMRTRAGLHAHTDEHKKKVRLVRPPAKGKLHQCNICKKKYNSRTLLQEHMNLHNGTRPHACAVCGKTFASKYTCQAHHKTHLERPRPFKCFLCPKSFLTQQNLNQHEKTHSGVKDFVCNICGKAFGTQHNLEVHGVVHSKSKPYVCGVCGKAFARRAEVKDHMRTHTGERPFRCEVCGATFAQRSNLHSHRRATHTDDKRYRCADCPKRFKRRRLLEYHIKASHTGERPLECEVCHATFVYPEHYKKHVRIHSGERPYTCEVCGKSFNSRDNRNTHRFVHSDKKPYECLVCGAGYMRKQLLYAHMNTSGHLAESIVVNQPRVQKVPESLVAQSVVHPNLETLIFQDTDELELNTTADKSIISDSENEPKLYITDDKKLILQDGKSTINLIQDSEDPTLLTLHNVEGGVKTDADVSGLLQSVTVDQLGEQSQMLGEGGGVVRLVQVQLENGTSGWVAIN